MNLALISKHSFFLGITLVLCLILFPTAFFLPASYYFENSWVENSQALILAAAALISFFQMKKAPTSELCLFWQGLTLFWIIAFFRELSWGRVFYQTGITESGPTFIPLHMLWYKNVIYFFLTLAISRALFCFYTARSYVLKILRRFHLSDVLFILLLLSCSQLVFEKGIVSLLVPYAQQLEETAELIAYWSALAMQLTVSPNLSKRAARNEQSVI